MDAFNFAFSLFGLLLGLALRLLCTGRERARATARSGVNARMLDGFEVREGQALIDGRELEVRYFDNAGD